MGKIKKKRVKKPPPKKLTKDEVMV